jgi:integrase
MLGGRTVWWAWPNSAPGDSTSCASHFRAREWKPAIRAAGIDPARRIYDMRHTYATFSLAAGVSLFALSRRMGTSVDMIDRTYGHLAADAEDYERGLLDAFDARYGHGLDTVGEGAT